MKVKELISKLKSMNPEATVVFCQYDGGGDGVFEISGASLSKKGKIIEFSSTDCKTINKDTGECLEDIVFID